MLTLAALTPVISWLYLNAATGILLTIPPRKRMYFLPTILIPSLISFKSLQHLNFVPGLPELWGLITFIGLIHFTSLLYVKRWTLRTTQHAKNESISTSTSRGEVFKLMYKVSSNPRFIRIPYKHPSLVLPKQKPSNGSQIKSSAIHPAFSARKPIWLLIKIGAYIALSHFTKTRLLDTITINDFTPVKATLLRRLLPPVISTSSSPHPISSNELLVRIWFTMNSLCAPILLLDCIHTILAIFSIYILRTDVSEDWPDLFGRPSEAYTLGRFWSRFWHRIHLHGSTDYANLLIHTFLPRQILRNKTIKRIIMTFLLFLISGLGHHLTSLQLHPGCSGGYADVKFFAVNAVVVVVEGAVLRLRGGYREDSGSLKDDGRRFVWKVLVRVLGYLWVVGFFVWAIPRFYYPVVYYVNQPIRIEYL